MFVNYYSSRKVKFYIEDCPETTYIHFRSKNGYISSISEDITEFNEDIKYVLSHCPSKPARRYIRGLGKVINNMRHNRVKNSNHVN